MLWPRSNLAQELNKASCPDKAKHLTFKKTKKPPNTIIKAAAAAVTLLHSVELELDQDLRQNNSSNCTVSGSDYLHPQQRENCEIQDKFNLRGIC